MTAWVTIRRFGAVVALFFGAIAIALADEGSGKPPALRPGKLTPTQLRETADRAEKVGDWEAAFNAYCHLYVGDRSSTEFRDKLNSSLRRVQQIRRHRDPAFQQFVASMPYSGGLDLFAEVVQKVPPVFADKGKATPQHLWAYAVEELERALANPTFRKAFLNNPRPDKVEQFRAALRSDWAKRNVSDHKEARNTLRRLILAAEDTLPVRVPAALAIECACGACGGLDEYTVFLSPNQLTESSAVPDLTAAGLYLGYSNNGLVIEGVVPNSWAALNYPLLRRGDRIVKLNGRPMDNTSLAAAAEALRNSVNGFHLLELPPVGDTPVIVRLPVAVPTVYGTKPLKEGIGYARIGNFLPSTPGELDDAITVLKAGGARVIVLDLRGNHGGSFLAGVETARRLLPSGLIVTTQGQISEVANQSFSSASGMSAHDIPVVLLIDAETASAAEVLAAALKDNNRATLVGMPSFGKGSVQYPLRLVSLDDDPSGKRPNKTGAVRVTIAKLVAPSGGPINGVGVNPDLLEADPDRQLDLAIQKSIEVLELLPPGMPIRPMPPMVPLSP